ncbi:MAG: SpoVG family protein, partial [Clostridia bacterium]|nr:SpoVG family protein [Clostridia bacterium]
GDDKLFIAMPSRKTPDNEFKDIAHPINPEMRAKLSDMILEKYHTTLVQEETEII